jgi:hypothetical protein
LQYPLRYPPALDARHLDRVLHLFTDTVGAWYRRHHPGGKIGSVTVIQRASSDLRLNPHFHTLFLDGVYVPAQCPSEGSHAAPSAPLFQAAPKPTQEDIEFYLCAACLRFDAKVTILIAHERHHLRIVRERYRV